MPATSLERGVSKNDAGMKISHASLQREIRDPLPSEVQRSLRLKLCESTAVGLRLTQVATAPMHPAFDN
jgi:hypothetical protein